MNELEGNIKFIEIDTSNKETQKEWGIIDGLFIDGKEIQLGPPPTYDKIKKIPVAEKILHWT